VLFIGNPFLILGFGKPFLAAYSIELSSENDVKKALPGKALNH
jgi:hypothetical protein